MSFTNSGIPDISDYIISAGKNAVAKPPTKYRHINLMNEILLPSNALMRKISDFNLKNKKIVLDLFSKLINNGYSVAKAEQVIMELFDGVDEK